MNRMVAFLLAQASLGGRLSEDLVDRPPEGGEPDGARARRRKAYRSLPPGEHLAVITKVERDAPGVFRVHLANPIEAERFAKAEEKRARKAAKR
jgi:hypothetical protein